MKHIVLLISLFTAALLNGQSINKQIEGSRPYLVGKINKEGLQSEPYRNWFDKNYQSSKPDPQTIQELKEMLPDYTIRVFLGTWCGDSRREVPRLYQLLDAASFPLQRLTTVALDKQSVHYRQSPGGEHEAMNVFRVPTFILLKDGKEVNRIIERPKASLEEDLLSMIKGDYSPNYQGVTAIIQLMEELGPGKFERKLDRIANRQGKEVENHYGLHTLAKVWYADEKQQEAIAISRLNCLIFPDEKSPKLLLASYLEGQGQSQDARMLYRQVLELEAENSTAKNALKRLATK